MKALVDNLIFNVESRIIRFLIAGSINTMCNYMLFVALIAAGLHYSLAVLLCTIFSILFNFKTFGKFVFNNSDNRLIFRFITVYALLYCINVLTLGNLKHFMNIYFASALLILPLASLSFLLNSRFVFGMIPTDN